MGQVAAEKEYILLSRLKTEPTRLLTTAKLQIIGGKSGPDHQGENFNYDLNLVCVKDRNTDCLHTYASSTEDAGFPSPGEKSPVYTTSAYLLPGTTLTEYFYAKLEIEHLDKDYNSIDNLEPTARFGGIRCDNERYRWPGCVFPNAIPTFTLELSHPEHGEAADHVEAALNAGYAPWLNLLTDKSAKRRNARKAKAKCINQFGDKPGWAGDCDEYPFSSSYQGCRKSNGLCSVRIISSHANRSAGGRLGGWLAANRMLDEDRYLVRVDP